MGLDDARRHRTAVGAKHRRDQRFMPLGTQGGINLPRQWNLRLAPSGGGRWDARPQENTRYFRSSVSGLRG